MIGFCIFWRSCTQYMKDANFYLTTIPNLLVWYFFCPLQIFMRSWTSLGQNNSIPSMVTSWWDSINSVDPAADMPVTLRHSCMVSGSRGGMAAVTAAVVYRFCLGYRHYDFILVFLVYLYISCFRLLCLVSFWVAHF